VPTVRELRQRWRALAAAGGVDPRDVDILLGDAAGKPLSWIIAHADDDVSASVANEVEEKMGRRLGREPLQYIRGRSEFFGREFLVDERVLIPRPETEHLVEETVRRIGRHARVLDLGTGSGCVAVSVALERPDVSLFASDLSPAALAVASRNAARLGAGVRFFASDACEAIGARARFDAIVSNPPYIPAREIPGLQAEVRDFEPHMALTPGVTGLEVIERIVERARDLLNPGGILLFEIGFGQSEAVAKLSAASGWKSAFVPDLQGIPRVAVLSLIVDRRSG
jgi:release factor glutamine methyltransferase